MNTFTIVGRIAWIGREVKDEKHPLFFTLACDRAGSEKTNFLPCELWGKVALSFQQYKKLGDQIAASGYIKHDRYEKDGEMIDRTILTVTRCEWLATPPKKAAPEPQRDTVPDAESQKDLPF